MVLHSFSSQRACHRKSLEACEMQHAVTEVFLKCLKGRFHPAYRPTIEPPIRYRGFAFREVSLRTTCFAAPMKQELLQVVHPLGNLGAVELLLQDYEQLYAV